jgi:hypothetical protein
MTKQSKSRYGWRWIIVLLGGVAWISIGCSPQTLSVFLMPFTDNSIDPEYKLFAADKKITLAIMSNFTRPEIHPELQGADAELADLVAAKLRERCQKNGHKIEIIPSVQVRSEEMKQRAAGDVNPIDLGKNLKAEYVLDLNINLFSIYEPNYFPKMFRGKTEIALAVYKIDAKNGEQKVFYKDHPRIYPSSSGPIDAGASSPAAFRRVFLAKVANDISKVLIAYPPEEKRELE